MRLAAALLLLPAFAPAPAAKLKLLSFRTANFDVREARVPQTIPRYDLPGNRLIFDQMDVRLVVVGTFDDWDAVYRINGLLDPDIQVPVGATLTFFMTNLGVRRSVSLSSGDPAGMTLIVGSKLSDLYGGRRPPWIPPRPRYSADPTPSRLPMSNQAHQLADVEMIYRAVSPGVAYWAPISWVQRGCYGRIIVVP